MTKNTELGKLGEDIAVNVLKSRGYEVVARNWRTSAGELDIITRVGEAYVFVEVKARTSDQFGLPEEAVTPEKGRRMLAAATAYLAEKGLDDVPWRVDMVAIEMTKAGQAKRVRVHRDAVRADG